MNNGAHITRRSHWDDEGGAEIGTTEWLEVLRDNPELGSVLVFNGGNIDAENTNASLLRAMLRIAAQLDATVQGDDGERFPDRESGEWWRGMRTRARSIWEKPTGTERDESRFRVGMHVRDTQRGTGEIVGFGLQNGVVRTVRVQFADGAVEERADAAAGLEPLD